MRALGITPILNVSSLVDSFAWFARLGWRRDWDYGDPPTFGSVSSGGNQVFLCLDGQGGRGPGQGAWMSVFVADVDAVHATCVEHGLEVIYPPTDEPWGVREMHVRHPDGHVFRIGRGDEPDHDHSHDHDHDHDHDHPHPH
jgi:predicted enzyme related to lactoylglutathione lyase